jgi:probable phosphoglycerate mutase
LSELGREDANAAASAVWSFGKHGVFAHMQPPTAVISSPILRTRETAQAIADKLGLSFQTDEDFAEISFGDWDGKTNDEAKALSPAAFEAWRGSWTETPPNGESLEAFDARIQNGLDRLLTEHEGKTVVVVAHVMPIRGLIRKALGGTASTYWSIQVAPCSITVIRFWGDQASEVVAVNSTGHLA